MMCEPSVDYYWDPDNEEWLDGHEPPWGYFDAEPMVEYGPAEGGVACSLCGLNGTHRRARVHEISVDTWTHDDGQVCSIANLAWPVQSINR